MQILRRNFVSALQRHSGLRCFSIVAQPDLTVQLSGLTKNEASEVTATPAVELSKLSNGMKICSVETQNPISSFGIFVNSGSMFESHDTNGMSMFMEHLFFKSTEKRSALRLMRDFQNLGAVVGGQSSRDCMMFSSEFLRDNAEKVMEGMAEALLLPKITAWDLDEIRKTVRVESEQLQENPQQFVTELLHCAAFGDGSSLGRSLFCPERNVDSINCEQVKEFLQDNFFPNNMVLVGVGMDHKKMVELGEKYFASQEANYFQPPTGSANAAKRDLGSEKSKYFGGSKMVESASPLTHVALGFESGSWASDDLLDICTLQYLMGGGGSFSAGGPGKGMYSRLYLNVLNKCGWVENCMAFNTLYKDTGVFGIFGSAEPENSGELVSVFINELKAIANGKMSEDEVTMAKNATKSSLLMKLEERAVLLEDLGRQALVFDKRITPQELCARVDKVSVASLQKLVQKLLKGKPSLAALGDLSNVPNHEKLSQMLK